MERGKESDDPRIMAGETIDYPPGGRLKVIQKKRGYRFSVDAILAAQFVRPVKGGAIIDLGTGSGVIAMILAFRQAGSRVVGIEIQSSLADMARRSVALNGMVGHVEIIEGDLRRIEDLIRPGSFDIAVSNPPYGRLLSGRVNPDGEKALARHEIVGSLDDFLRAAEYALKPGGRVSVVYPARRMVELLCRMRHHRLEPKRCRMVHSYPGKRGDFILAEGIEGGREEVAIESPLYIYDPDGNYSEAMVNLFNDVVSSP
jgi:tRNA1Val (adenine37-N6)-methyltransferase